MKYKVGDKVRVREDLKHGMDIMFGVSKEMEALAGKTVTISEVYSDRYYIKEDGRNICYSWSDEMFEDKPTTLSTAEMIAALAANPEQRYSDGKAIGGGICSNTVGMLGGELVWICQDGKTQWNKFGINSVTLPMQWTLIPPKPQPVPFEEARKAHAAGKNIRVDYPNFNDRSSTVTEYYWKNSIGGDESKPSTANISFYMINNGIWTVED